MVSRILTPREVVIGGGTRRRLPDVLTSVGGKNPLLIADPVMVKLGHTDELTELLKAAGFTVSLYSQVVEDPTDVSILEVSSLIRDGGHDSVIALGGGSAMDTAKAGAIVASLGEDVRSLKVPRIVDAQIMPVIAIPTTAGTGSEVARAAVVTDTAAHEKMLILGTAALPAAAIVDYELTISCPPSVTAFTGIDALTHALEALVNRNSNAYADGLALSALELIGANLVTACEHGSNLAARETMMLGATLAGMAVSNTGTALIHGLSRPIGAFFHVPHGLSNAMVLPLVTRYSLASAYAKYAAAAKALGVAAIADTDHAAAEKLVGYFSELNHRLNVPTPKDFGIDAAEYQKLIPEMVRQGLDSGTPRNNPRVPTPDEMADLYEQAYGGGTKVPEG